MLNINITVFDNKGEKYYFLRYNAWNRIGCRAYKTTDTLLMINDLKASLSNLNPRHLETIVLTSEINNEGHEEYNPIGMRILYNLISKQFPNSKIIYEISKSTTQSQDYKQ